MTIIKDIRIFKSNVENVDGNSHPTGILDKEINIAVHRIVMKLREKNFSLGDFHHLYINFTTCFVENGIALSKRSKDRYSPWFRYYDVMINQDLFDILGTPQSTQAIFGLLEKVLQDFFSTEQFTKEAIHLCVLEAITQGENMLMKFKEKRTSNNRAVIYLRYLNNGHYFPLLRVFDMEDNLLLEEDLPETDNLGSFGDILLSRKKITIKPRKNVFAKGFEPISFEL